MLEGSADSWSFGDGVAPGRPRLPSRPANVESLRPGDVFGQFSVLSVLGRGGMGVVLRARDAQSGREVALKILTGRLHERARKRFKREGELTANLRHPNIVRVHSGGEHAGIPYLAYELVPGSRTLDAISELDRPARLDLLLKVARALAFAHEQGVVHRDIKPENILVDEAGEPHLADFGLASATGLDRLTQSGAMLGTPVYMSPEQYQAEGQVPIRPPADVWALGVLLYRELTGQLPFEASTMVELMGAVTLTHPTSPRGHDPSISRSLEAVCLKALAKAPEDRYADAGAFAQDLENAIALRPVSASSWNLQARLRRSSRWLVPLALAVALVLVVLIVTRDPGEPADSADLATLVTQVEEGTADRAALEELLGEDPEAEPTVLARAHLLLATGPSTDAAGWERRVEHARRAGELDPRRRGEAELARGQALLALDRPAEARDAFAAAWTATRDLAAIEARVQLLWQLDDPAAEAASISRQLGKTKSTRGQVLLAEARAAADRDPSPLIDLGSRGARGATAALARHLFLIQRDARAARATLDREDSDSLRTLLVALTDSPPDTDALGTALPGLRHASCAWLLDEASRELAFLAHAEDPRFTPQEGAPSLDRRRARARQALEAVLVLAPRDAAAVRAHLALARITSGAARADHVRRALAIRPQAPRVMVADARARLEDGRAREALEVLARAYPTGSQAPRHVHWLRGRAYVASGKANLAVAPLKRADPQGMDPRVQADLVEALDEAGDADLAAQRTRLARLRGGERPAAGKLFMDAYTQRRRTPAHLTVERYRKALELDPMNHRARLFMGVSRYDGGEKSGLLDVLQVAVYDPDLVDEVAVWMRVLTAGAVERNRLTAMAPSIEDRRLRAFVGGMAVEIEQADALIRPALTDLDAVLAADPADVVARALRGFVRLRAGRLDEAEGDLRIAEAAAPDVGVIAVYQALLLARRSAKPEAVLRRLGQVVPRGFRLGRGKSVSIFKYPELVPYRGRRGFED